MWQGRIRCPFGIPITYSSLNRMGVLSEKLPRTNDCAGRRMRSPAPTFRPGHIKTEEMAADLKVRVIRQIQQLRKDLTVATKRVAALREEFKRHELVLQECVFLDHREERTVQCLISGFGRTIQCSKHHLRPQWTPSTEAGHSVGIRLAIRVVSWYLKVGVEVRCRSRRAPPGQRFVFLRSPCSTCLSTERTRRSPSTEDTKGLRQ